MYQWNQPELDIHSIKNRIQGSIIIGTPGLLLAESISGKDNNMYLTELHFASFDHSTLVQSYCKWTSETNIERFGQIHHRHIWHWIRDAIFLFQRSRGTG